MNGIVHSPFIPPWLDDAQLSATQFRILAHLWRRAGRSGQCWPSARSIAEACKINRDSVWPAIAVLEERGYLKREKKTFKGSNHYTLTFGGKEVSSIGGNGGSSPSGKEGAAIGGKEGPQNVFSEKPPIIPPRNVGNEIASAPDDKSSDSKAVLLYPSLCENDARGMVQAIIQKEQGDRHSELSCFPSEEIEQWAVDWYLENIENNWHIKGVPIKNPEAALRRFLRAKAETKTKRFRELIGSSWEGDD